MNKLICLAALLASVCLPGCSSVYYKDACVAFEVHKYMMVETAQRIKIAERPTTGRGYCTVHVDVTGAESDQVQAIGVAVDAAVSAAVKGVKP